MLSGLCAKAAYQPGQLRKLRQARGRGRRSRVIVPKHQYLLSQGYDICYNTK